MALQDLSSRYGQNQHLIQGYLSSGQELWSYTGYLGMEMFVSLVNPTLRHYPVRHDGHTTRC